MKLAVGVVALVLGLVILGSGAGAATLGPDDKGWWSRAQAAPAPAPTVPVGTATAGNLLVANDPTGPNALAAVRYSVPGTIDGEPVDATTASGTLTLKVAANGAVGTPVVIACPIISSWQSADGGTWDARPKYTCATKAVGTFTADATAVTFALTPNLQARPGVFDVAIVPDPANQTPFSVQFTPPGADSLDVRAAGAPTPTSAGATASPPASDTGSSPGLDSTGSAAFPSVFPTLGVAPDGSALPAPGAAPSTGASVAASPTLTFASPSGPVSDKRAQRAVALALLTLIALAVWWFGGQPVRAPRLLGSLASDADADADAKTDDTIFVRSGGIGRFARPRSDRPPHL